MKQLANDMTKFVKLLSKTHQRMSSILLTLHQQNLPNFEEHANVGDNLK